MGGWLFQAEYERAMDRQVREIYYVLDILWLCKKIYSKIKTSKSKQQLNGNFVFINFKF